MLNKIDNKDMGKSNLGWLNSSFHFSFSEYYNPRNINFGVLRVLNDDIIQPNTGFKMHPHKDMEIVTYVINGKLTHKDSMGNLGEVARGEVQYMSAGTGIYHSEYNLGNKVLRLLQIWIFPDKEGYRPNYGQYNFNWNDRENKWFHIVSKVGGSAPIKVNADTNICVLYLNKGKEAELNLKNGRQAYLVQIEGKSKINEIELNEKDALEIIEENIRIKSNEDSHFLVIEMNKAVQTYI
ncbi:MULTISPECIES: pirin family protein [unclassified Clostridium]|uniref:pirin family protein n=1 Tax=unclassified Clostridium TaxID=2614128 RepID=UPI00029742B9|nr:MULTISPECIES: pirin family protein [unclassified Clostridium]EKQ58259.1 MAG: Pirin-related protein [Clostridium sp. Maddingley MBC34-26]